MPAVPYTEQILTTSNTKLAAVLYMFGARLRKVLPIEWIDEFADKKTFIAMWDCEKQQLRDPTRKPKKTVFFNFDPLSVDARAVTAAFGSETAEEEFTNLLNDSAVEESVRTKLLAAHSRAVAANAREALSAKEYLIRLMNAVPETAKWNRVRGVGKGQFAQFGKQATKETIAEYLSKI
jgi:hypothetical protein